MTTSGTYRLSTTFDELAEEALDLLQIGADGETLSADQELRCKKTFNFMLKAWEGQGIHLWTMEEGTLFLVKGQSEYDFSTANLANTWYETTLSADEAAAQTTLSITSTTNIAANDVVGIVLDDDTLHWSTVSSKTATEIVIADGLASAASSGAKVRTYVASSFIPVNRILECRRRESSTYEIPINFESRKDYFWLPDKSSTGQPIQAYFSRQEPPGKMYIWPPPNDAEICINFSYERPIQSIGVGTETIDIPEYWFEACIYNLAKRLILKFGCTEKRALFIRDMAVETLDIALDFDSDLYPFKMKVHG